MNIISFSKSFGVFGVHLDCIGAFAFGFGFNFFPQTVGFGFSLGPLVVSVTYTKPGTHQCVDGSCSHAPQQAAQQ